MKKYTIGLSLLCGVSALLLAGGEVALSTNTAKADAVSVNFVMNDGAAVHKDGGGLRFSATLDAKTYGEIKVANGKVGMIIVPSDSVYVDSATLEHSDSSVYSTDSAYELTVENVFGEHARFSTQPTETQRLIINEVATDENGKLVENDGNVTVYGSIENFLQQNYVRSFVGRAYYYTESTGYVFADYYDDKDNDLENPIENNTRCMYYVAQKAIEANDVLSESVQTTYIDGFSAYLTENDKSGQYRYFVDYYYDGVCKNTETVYGTLNEKVSVKQSTKLHYTKDTENSVLDGKVYAAGKQRLKVAYKKRASDWTLWSNENGFTYDNGIYTASASDYYNKNYLVLTDTDGYRGTNTEIPTQSGNYYVRQNMIANEANYIRFTVQVTSGKAMIWAPYLNGNVHLDIGETSMSYACSVKDSKFKDYGDIIRLYTADGTRLFDYNTLTKGAAYTVVIAYDTTATGWSEIAIKGAATNVKVSEVEYLSEWKNDSFSSSWMLKSESVNTFENNKLTLSENIWADYLTLSALNARFDPKTHTNDTTVRTYMQNKGFAYVEFTVRVESGAARIYLPVIDENDADNTQAYVVFTADGKLSAVNDCVWNYVTVTTADGSTVEKNGAIAKDATYTVRIKYETNATGWADISIKGSATVVTLSDAKFYASSETENE